MTKVLTIGTRRSALAMWQTDWVAALLREFNPGLRVEVVPVQTLGDRDKATSLVGLGRVGVFTKEIEDALLAGQCDLAVHSYKDLATSLPRGLIIGATLEREDPRDVMVSRSGSGLDDLPPGTVVGTSSLRRRSLLLHRRPDLRIAGLRGNVPTRLRAAGAAVEGGSEPKGDPVDATVMALAGLKRLGLQRHVSQILEPSFFLSAPAQGVVAVQIREDDGETRRAIQRLDHEPTRRVTDAERTFLRTMEGGCHMPLGALAVERGSGDLTLDGIVLSLDGTRHVRACLDGKDPARLGEDLAVRLREDGADEILREVAAHNLRGEDA